MKEKDFEKMKVFEKEQEKETEINEIMAKVINEVYTSCDGIKPRAIYYSKERFGNEYDYVSLSANNDTFGRIIFKDGKLIANGVLVRADEEVSSIEEGIRVLFKRYTSSLLVVADVRNRKQNTVNLDKFKLLKSKHHDALFLFRFGGFYETYMDDATTAANVLGITLTRSTKQQEDDGSGLRMAEFPYFRLDEYLPKLIRAGHRIAICDSIY